MLATPTPSSPVAKREQWLKPDSNNWAKATYNLGWAYRHVGRYREAMAMFREADAVLHPNGLDVEGLLFYAELQHDQGLGREARATLDEAAKLIPKEPSQEITQKGIEGLREEVRRVRELLGKASSK